MAEAIADGTWTPDSPGSVGGNLSRELEILAAIAAVHRGVSAESGHETWNGLQLRERIGEGAFGEVYRAWDPKLEREVALKLLREPVLDPAAGAQLIAEARLLARVRHPNVATVYGADVVDGRAGVWMELVGGDSLESVVGNGGPLPVSRALEIGGALCSALQAVHDAGVAHGDV